MSTFDPDALECLAAIVEEGGFERAALRLAITQSAVSQRLRALEVQVGTVLIVRSRPLKATTAGRLPLAEFNTRAAAFRPAQMSEDFRFVCDTTAKFHPGDERVQQLYRLEQAGTPLEGKGTGLTQSDIERIRSARA